MYTIDSKIDGRWQRSHNYIIVRGLWAVFLRPCNARLSSASVHRELAPPPDPDTYLVQNPAVIEVKPFPFRGCLVARKWAEVRKLGSIIAHFLIYPNTGKRKMRKSLLFLFSLLHNHFLTSRVLQLIL